MGARVELNGPAMQIPHTLGTQAGANLFHSFQRFNIPTRNSATFTGPGGIDNVVSRVTGGEASTIDGAFRSTIPGADVWFTNPAGVTFGPNASLDVPASFHASTANEIRFPDGGRFSADLGATSTLSVAPPEAFGFLSSNPAPLQVEGSRLSTVTNATLALAAGGIEIQGNAPTPDPDLPVAGGTLRAPSGTINLASVAGPAEVKTDGTILGNNHGAIRLTDGALVNASGDGAGVVRIRGGELTATGSYIIASNTGSVAGAGGIDISADRLNLQDDLGSPSLVAANAHNAGDAPPINVRAPDIAMRNSDIRSNAYAAGKAGNIQIDAANQMTLDNFAWVHANSLGLDPTGAGGNITVNAGNLAIRDRSEIRSSTFGPAPAGNITVIAGTVLVGPGTRIDTEAFGSGNAGAVSIRADNLTLGPDARIDTSNGIGSPGSAGAVIIQASNLILDTNARVFTGTFGSGNAGAVSIRADNLTLGPDARIYSDTFGSGNAGTVSIHADNLTLGPDARIDTSTTFGSGNAGAVSIHADNLTLGPDALISSRSFGLSGKAGNIIITGVSNLFMSDGAMVTTLSTFAGGGNIEIRGAGIIVLRDDSRISVDTMDGEQAGDITIDSRFLVLDRSKISADAAARTGGNIRIAPSTRVFRSPDSEITARGGPAGVAGMVLMNPQTDVTIDVAQLPGEVMNTAGQMQERCAVRGLVEGSSFTIAGPEAASPALEGYLPGTYAGIADETAVADGSLMVARGGLASAAWIVACGEAR